MSITAEKVEQIARMFFNRALPLSQQPITGRDLQAHWDSPKWAIFKALCFDDARAIISLLQRGELDGWKLVPVKPDQKMMDAGDEAIILGLQTAQAGLNPKHPTSAAAEVYEAMLSASLPHASGAETGNSVTLEQVSKIVTAWSDETFGSPLTFQARDDLLGKLSPFLSSSRQAALEEAARDRADAAEAEIARLKGIPAAQEFLCEVTGNPSGTDTWALNYTCPCKGCQQYLAASRPRFRKSLKGIDNDTTHSLFGRCIL